VDLAVFAGLVAMIDISTSGIAAGVELHAPMIAQMFLLCEKKKEISPKRMNGCVSRSLSGPLSFGV
jgi:hypothetical protein